MSAAKMLGVVLLLACALGLTDTARAGWLFRRDPDCPRPAYSPLHYWAPTLVRWWETHRGYGVGCGNTLYPDIPGDARIIRYACQYAEPGTIPYGISPPPAQVIPVYPYGSMPPITEWPAIGVGGNSFGEW